MPHCIAGIFEPLLQMLWPARGRHRRPVPSSAGLAVEASTARPRGVPATQVLRGEENRLVRPYLVAHERREAQKQQTRCRLLRVAVRGIDMGPRLMHGVEVTS